MTDSTQATQEHIDRVQDLISEVRQNLMKRGMVHDASKLEEPEKSMFDEVTIKLSDMEYGSDEYKAVLEEMKKGALAHHYAENDHHPEHGDGTLGWMNLLQLLEMLCDWKAAGERHPNGDLHASILKNAERFGYGPEMTGVLKRTANELGWL